MRAATIFLALLATIAAFNIPTAATRSLSQDAVPADTAAATAAVPAANPAATLQQSTGVFVEVEVDVEGASCTAVRNRVRTGVNGWFKRVFFLVNVNVDATKCSVAEGTATVVVRVRVPGVPVLGVDVRVIVNTINKWVQSNVSVDQWAKSVKEINSLVKWADNKQYKITRVNVQVLA